MRETIIETNLKMKTKQFESKLKRTSCLPKTKLKGLQAEKNDLSTNDSTKFMYFFLQIRIKLKNYLQTLFTI